MQKIIPSLWFNYNAEEAVAFYTSIFPESRIVSQSYYTEDSPGSPGEVMTIEFELMGERFLAINGGPEFPFTNAVSFWVDCSTQAEIDKMWDALLAGGKAQQCGWLTDRFGLSWQIVPRLLSEMVADPNPAKAQAVMQAMLKMVKIDLDTIKQAFNAA